MTTAEASPAPRDAVRRVRAAMRWPWPLVIAAAVLWFDSIADMLADDSTWAVSAAGLVGIVLPVVWQRLAWHADVRRFRREAGLCANCLYHREGLAPDAPCPECGTPPPPTARPEALALARRCPPLLRATRAASLERAIERTGHGMEAWSPWPAGLTAAGVWVFLLAVAGTVVLPDDTGDMLLAVLIPAVFTVWAARALFARETCLEHAEEVVRVFETAEETDA